MARTSGRPDVTIGLIDGPVSTGHPDLQAATIRPALDDAGASCAVPPGEACEHGTFIAGILVARRGARAPAICPGCTLVVYPIFRDAAPSGAPTATPEELARGITACVTSGARVLNISATTGAPSTRVERVLHGALDFAAERGTLVVAAAGNQATLGSWSVTRHPWVVPVAGCDELGRRTSDSNLGFSVGRRGLGAPGDGVESLGANGAPRTSGGTSCAAAFVTGAIALLWSLFPTVGASAIRYALVGGGRRSVAPPLLDADAAFTTLVDVSRGR